MHCQVEVYITWSKGGPLANTGLQPTKKTQNLKAAFCCFYLDLLTVNSVFSYSLERRWRTQFFQNK